MCYVQNDMGKSMGSLTQRQAELIKDNAKMLDWAMATTSNKKKIPAPKVTISDYIPFNIWPPYEYAIQGPLVSQEPIEPKEKKKHNK